MKRNKFFSPALMLEGIKQTKVVGICFAIVSILLSCYFPFLKIMESSANYWKSDVIMDLGSFVLPIFVLQYLMPIVVVFVLFNFMNSRKASDFYHSIPLSKTCIYVTYTIVALLWSLAVILVSTFLSYILYSFAPEIIINSEFIWTTIISSFILAMLITSITLVAKGLSGTLFTNIIITLIIMFLPRIIILLYTSAVNAAVKITDVSFMSFADIYNNIIFAPFTTNQFMYGYIKQETLPISNASTLWYSAILAIIYFVIGFFINKFRKSESAGKSAAYKGVQPVVRILLGSIPLLLISTNLACGLNVSVEFWFIGIVISLLAYFLYELITTKNAKKLLTAIPFYLIAILVNAIFVVACVGEKNFILNDIPEPSEISSVSISNYIDYSNAINIDDNYYKYKAEDVKFNDKELIDILQSSLVDTVEKVKESNFDELTRDNYMPYDVIIHCSSGRDIKRTIYVNINKYNGSSKPSLDSYLYKNQEYMDILFSLPTDKELKSIKIDSSNMDFSKDELNELWKTYKEEFNSASDKNKSILSYRDNSGNYDNIYGINNITNIKVTGYVGMNNFSQHYLVNANITPKTYSKLINKTMSKLIKDNIIDTVKKNESDAAYFRLDFSDLKNTNNNFILEYYNDNIGDDDLMMSPSVDGTLKRYNVNYSDSGIDKKYIPELRKISNIIINAISDNVDVEKDNLIQCSLSTNVNFEYSYDDDRISGYSLNSQSETVYVNITDEQYDEINNILSKCSKHTNYVDTEN
ncbi:hypothetical protein [Candidatus Pseudoruminococcus sp.]|uniref:hypothetical protein n=1 Tax=Candidatus Pseudoruminococcus sp. TaxID=3101048 RepID=UPI00399BCCB4